MWRSEDCLMETLLSYHVGPREKTQVIWLRWKQSQLWAISLAPSKDFFCPVDSTITSILQKIWIEKRWAFLLFTLQNSSTQLSCLVTASSSSHLISHCILRVHLLDLPPHVASSLCPVFSLDLRPLPTLLDRLPVLPPPSLSDLRLFLFLISTLQAQQSRWNSGLVASPVDGISLITEGRLLSRMTFKASMTPHALFLWCVTS